MNNIRLKDLPNNVAGIYKLNYPNGKIYIGLSTNIKRRMYEHNNSKRLKNHPNYPCDLAIQKYGPFEEIEILEYVDNLEKLGERERFWIQYYHANDKKIGYNLTPGGEQKDLKNEETPNATFSNKEVLDIRKRRFKGERKKDVYKDYSNHPFSTFEKVWLGNSYSDVGREYIIPTNLISRQEYSSKANRGSNNHNAKLNEEMVKNIRKRYDEGESPINIHKDYSMVNLITIQRVCERKTWKHVI